MDQWLDSLSEDWPSQPPSQQSSSILRDGSHRDHNGSQSRIPKPRLTSNSPSSTRKELGRRELHQHKISTHEPLKVKTSSSLNASHRRGTSSNSLAMSTTSGSKPVRCLSAALDPIGSQGTVAYRDSPTKDDASHGTPEWKRRIVQGKIGAGDQTDMFGPMGLQSVFRPPTIASREQPSTTVGSSRATKVTSGSMAKAMPLTQDSASPNGGPMLPAPRQPKKDEKCTEDRQETSDRSASAKSTASMRDSRVVGMAQTEMLEEEEHDGSVCIHSEQGKGAEGDEPDFTFNRSSVVRQQDPSQSLCDPASTMSCTHGSEGQDNSGFNNENISPFFVSKTHTMDGRVDYKAIDTSMRRLHSNMEQLRQQQQSTLASHPHDRVTRSSRNVTPEGSIRQSHINEITSQSLPEDLSVGTNAFAANGGFVSVHRGGYSDEGSFNQRLISPSETSINIDGPSALPTQLSSLAQPSRQHCDRQSEGPSTRPETPRKGHDVVGGNPDRPRSSGSPLKLFDKYDTFTNNRLNRHISRFEESLAQGGASDEPSGYPFVPSSPSPGKRASRRPSHRTKPSEDENGNRSGSFGLGELDEHAFQPNHQSEPFLPHWSPQASGPSPPPIKRRTHSSVSHNDKSSSKSRRSHSGKTRPLGSLDGAELHSWDEGKTRQHANQSTEDISYSVHGKRVAISPVKDPASKRRRTLCSSEERKRSTMYPVQSSEVNAEAKESPLPTAHGRKRKDARYDNYQQAADPKTIAMRQILRPRNPTPNQTNTSARRSMKKPVETSAKAREAGANSFALPMEVSPPPKVDPPTQIVAGALATIALNTVQDIESGSRKVSVTTSDFFNEAQQIMALIRAEKRPRSRHTTAETSEAGPSTIAEESFDADSTKDDFSRPPSREGGSMRKLLAPMQNDARAVSHLRKFEDQDDLGLAIPSSIRSLRIKGEEDEDESGTESDPPNIRFLARRPIDQEQKPSASSDPQTMPGTAAPSQSVNSQGSSGRDTSKSGQTKSSKSSVNMKKIAPQSVAHLLSDQMADMVFDKERQMWRKRKISMDPEASAPVAHLLSDGTEEDLFRDIPDLSVDEMDELRRVKEVVSLGNTLSLGGSLPCKPDGGVHDVVLAARMVDSRPIPDTRPRTADGKIIPLADTSSAPSKYTDFAWSGPVPGTRATSYGDNVWPDKGTRRHEGDPPPQETVETALYAEEVEHEINIFEGRMSRAPERGHRQTRVVTVAFSSPLVQSPYPADKDWEDGNESRLDDSPSHRTSQVRFSMTRPTSSGFQRPQTSRRVSRRLSMGNTSFSARPMSRLEEQDEVSLVQYAARRPSQALDLAISTPLILSRSLMVPPTTERSSLDFRLSPMPDFTVHQIDRPLDAEEGTSAKNRHVLTEQRGVNVLSLTAQDLVKHLTDYEPYEPYWDQMPVVSLQNRGLTSLHMLDGFCGRTRELDVSNNCIRDLTGVPVTVRLLDIRANCLSDLTAWHTLLHLQYLDVSGNQLQSLKGFQGLIHLRDLKADDNAVEQLDGIEHLDGLLRLSLRGNMLREVDFEGYELKRLVDLDLRRNSLVHVAGMSHLSSLEKCNLSRNDLERLQIHDPMPSLHNLDLSDNRLTNFDISTAPALRNLSLDRNAIDRVSGLEAHRNLTSLSWRDQRISPPLALQYQPAHELRAFFLSSTSLSTFVPSISFLNLNTLELASIGLQSLPQDFGLKCRNIRTLNLNYNAIHDIRPLLGIERLQTLHLAGNRLSRLRRTAAVIDRLSDELAEVDLRNNPLTVGFYTPQPPIGAGSEQEKRIIVHVEGHSPSVPTEAEHDLETKSAQAHVLPTLDKDLDAASRERLDEDTKLRRRVYEMLLVNAAKQLTRLDGLPVDRGAVGRKDGVWERLVELGVLREGRGARDAPVGV